MFFFFESDEERRVREDVEKNMEICLESPSKYATALKSLVNHVNKSDQRAIQQLVDTIKATIKNEDLQPIRKFQAILLLSDLMKTHNKALGKYVVKKTLKRLTILAQHKAGTKEQGEEDRGKDIFGEVKRDQEKYAVDFLNTLLMALEEWGTKWPKAPDGPYKDFHRQYNDLVMNGVKFPKLKPKQSTMKAKSSEAVPKSVSPTGKSLEKRPSSIRQSKIKEEIKPEKKPAIRPDLQRRLTQFFQQMVESLNLFCQFLETCPYEELSVLNEIVAEMKKGSEKGNELVIQLEGGLQNSSQAKKIETVFSFIEILEKELKIITKKSEKFDTFQRKYIKEAKSTSKLLSQKEKKPAQGGTISSIEKPSSSEIKTESITPKLQSKLDVPKILPTNRYTSVTGGPVLDKFGQQPKQSETGEPKADSVHSERFGSFGGPTTDRHRATIATGSPQRKNKVEKANSNQNSDRKNSTSIFSRQNSKQDVPAPAQKQKIVSEIIKPVEVIVPKQEKRKVQVQAPDKVISTKQIIPQKQRDSAKVSDFFDQFNVPIQNPAPSNPISSSFKANDSFGGFGEQKSISKDHSQVSDFFQNIQKSKPAQEFVNVQPRRRPQGKVAEEKILPSSNLDSKISGGLSAFDIKNGGDNSDITGNKSENKMAGEPPSKKSMSFENAFGSGANVPDPAQSRVSQKQKSVNFFDSYLQNSAVAAPVSQLAVPKATAIQFDASSGRVENPFATGNFGHLANQIKKQQQSDLNPFETESNHSKQLSLQRPSPPNFQNSFEGPFQTRRRSQHSQESKKNPFQTNTEQKSIENPFETSTHKSQKNKILDEMLQIFKPPSVKQVENLSQRGSFKKIAAIPSDRKESEDHSPSQFVRQSIVFTVDLNKSSQPGLNLSQFPDVRPSNEINADNPFDTNSEKNSKEHQKSGFSLSNFDPIDPFASAGPNEENKDTKDFFASFDKQSEREKKEKKSVSSKPRDQDSNIKNTQDFFDQFNVGVSAQGKKSQPSVQVQSKSIQKQKTIKSSSSNVFDFDQLQQISGIQKDGANSKKKNEVRFSDFGEWGRTSVKETKQGIVIDNASQPSIGWDKVDQLNRQVTFDDKPRMAQTSQFQENKSNLLEMQSRSNFSKKDLQDQQIIDSKNRPSQQHSIEINFEDLAPLSKKGIEWNPLSLIPNLKPPSFTYILDQSKLKQKKGELQSLKQQYNENLQQFRARKQKNDQIRCRLLQKMQAVQDIISQKGEFQQILKKIKQANEIKQKQISEINKKTKNTEQIRQKILVKEKQLYQLTKNQMNLSERKTPIQRTLANKWELFNKNLSKTRNSATPINSRFSQY